MASKITDLAYVSIGSNCALYNSTLPGYDSIFLIIANTYIKIFDYVGKMLIGDNSFISNGVIIVPDVVISPNSVIIAGSVVNKDVPLNPVVGSVPVNPTAIIESLLNWLGARTNTNPWTHLICERVETLDPGLEQELTLWRVGYLYGR